MSWLRMSLPPPAMTYETSATWPSEDMNGLRRFADSVDREDRRRELLDRRLRRRFVGAGDHDVEFERRPAGPLLIEEVDRLDPVERVGE